MKTSELQVIFQKRAKIDLADNEKVSLWEPMSVGKVRFQEDAIRLDGKWRVSAIGNFLGGGILGELLIKPFFTKERIETISISNLERVVIHRKKKNITFHLFQTRDHGVTEVHVLSAENDLVDALKATVPANLLQEQN